MFLQNKYTKCYFSIIDNSLSRVLTCYTEKHHIVPRSLGGDDNTQNIAILTAREHFICHLLLPKMVTGVARRNMSFAIWSMLNRDHSKNKSRYRITSHLYELLKKKVAQASSDLHRGKIVSADTRRKISEKATGRPSKQKGTIRSDAIREKMSKSVSETYKNGRAPNSGMTGRTHSEESKRKIQTSRYGYRHSDEAKTKISNSNKGKHNSPCPDHRKQYFSELYTGRAAPWRVGVEPANKGKVTSDETKAKQRESHKNRPQTNCPHCNKTVTTANYSRWHGDNCKFKL